MPRERPRGFHLTYYVMVNILAASVTCHVCLSKSFSLHLIGRRISTMGRKSVRQSAPKPAATEDLRGSSVRNAITHTSGVGDSYAFFPQNTLSGAVSHQTQQHAGRVALFSVGVFQPCPNSILWWAC
jgi:hypothetical protein